MARDPNRIPEVFNALHEYWAKNPDLRLGQILSNAAGDLGYRSLGGVADPFYLEDERFVEWLKAHTDDS